MEDTEAPNAQIDLLHPELLSNDTIIQLLSDRNVTTDAAQQSDRERLLELYYQHVIPRPQRKHRNSRSGLAMTKKQMLINKRKRPHSDISGAGGDGFTVKKAESESAGVAKSGLINAFSTSPATDRLKPPPSAINFEKKVIKLGASSSAQTGSTIQSQHNTIKLTKSPLPQPSTISKANGDTNDSKVPIRGPVKLTKILPQKLQDAKAGRKIQLKRPGAYEVGSETLCMDTQNSLTDTPHNDTPPSANAVTASSEHEEEEEEEVPLKKFKRVSVKWP